MSQSPHGLITSSRIARQLAQYHEEQHRIFSNHADALARQNVSAIDYRRDIVSAAKSALKLINAGDKVSFAVATVAAQYQVPQNAVAANVDLMRRDAAKRQAEERRKKALELRQQNLTIRAIGKRLSVPKSTVARLLAGTGGMSHRSKS